MANSSCEEEKYNTKKCVMCHQKFIIDELVQCNHADCKKYENINCRSCLSFIHMHGKQGHDLNEAPIQLKDTDIESKSTLQSPLQSFDANRERPKIMQSLVMKPDFKFKYVSVSLL